MQPPLPTGTRTFSTPSFYLTGRQRISPGAILLAIVAAVGALCTVAYVMSHTRHGHINFGGSAEDVRAGAAAGGSSGEDDDADDDPSQIDTIYLGDPADAPVPARRGDHVSPVHPTILIKLPRYGDQTGMIPATNAGHLLYDWLAAFNQSSPALLADALPSLAPTAATAAQMQLRRQTGGFNLLSAKEVQPGVLVFRLRDQTPLGTEVLGTLWVREDSIPAKIQSFSLRAVDSPR